VKKRDNGKKKEKNKIEKEKKENYTETQRMANALSHAFFPCETFFFPINITLLFTLV